MSSEAGSIIDDGVNELIINAVQGKPQLWDMSLKSYKDNELKKKSWAEMSFDLKVDAEFIKTRWRSLRDRFMKERKKVIPKSGQAAATKSGWHLMLSMQFLSATVASRKTSTSMQSASISHADIEKELSSPRVLVTGTADEMTPFGNELQIVSETCAFNDLQRNNAIPQISFINDANINDLSIQPNVNRAGVSPANRPGSSSNCQYSSRPTSAQSSSRPTKRARNFSPDPVEKAVLEMVHEKNRRTIHKLTPDEHFYLAIAKDVQDFDLSMRLEIRKAVLDTVSIIIEANSE